MITKPLPFAPDIQPNIPIYFFLGEQFEAPRLCHFSLGPQGVFGGMVHGRGFRYDRIDFCEEMIGALHMAVDDRLTEWENILGFSRHWEFRGSNEEFVILNSAARMFRDYHAAKASAYEHLAAQVLDNATEITGYTDIDILDEWYSQHDRLEKAKLHDEMLRDQYSELLGTSRLYGTESLSERWDQLQGRENLVIGRY